MKAKTKPATDALKETMARLEALGDEKVRARNWRNGDESPQFGVPMGELRKVAKALKANHELALALWATGNMDAKLLAILLLKPKDLSVDEMDRMARESSPAQVAEWFNAYVAKNHPEKEALREKWMRDVDPWAARAGWSLTSERVGKGAEGLDPAALLKRLEKEMGKADPATQWTMNNCLATIGINFPELRERAIAIGEKLGVYRDYPCSKGCTSPFAPIWINEMVKRKG
jgi:3-methyladenine DNA glycosylase AlkD